MSHSCRVSPTPPHLRADLNTAVCATVCIGVSCEPDPAPPPRGLKPIAYATLYLGGMLRVRPRPTSEGIETMSDELSHLVDREHVGRVRPAPPPRGLKRQAEPPESRAGIPRAQPRPTSVGRGTLCCSEGLSYSGVLPRLTALPPARTPLSTPTDARSGSGDGPSSKGQSARHAG